MVQLAHRDRKRRPREHLFLHVRLLLGRGLQLVAIGDDHADEKIQRFRLRLIGDARFDTRVKDIVVEFGNARSQDVK